MSIVKFELNETRLALQLRSTLEQADSCYTKEYLPFAQANAKLSDDAFVDTLERQFAAKLLYVAWHPRQFPESNAGFPRSGLGPIRKFLFHY